MYTIGFIAAVYLFARKYVENEPLKKYLDVSANWVNEILNSYKNQEPKYLFERLLILSNKIIFYSLLVIFVTMLLPKDIGKMFIGIIAPIAVISMLLSFSIKWIQYHNKTLKEYFFNLPMLGVLFSPLIFYYIGKYPLDPNININDVFLPFKFIIDRIGIFYFQLLWLAGVSVFIYFGAVVIAFPIYYILYGCIILTALFIKFTEKYISKNVLDVIVGLIALFTGPFLKMFS